MGFLSDDDYEFIFAKLSDPPPLQLYLDIRPEEVRGFEADDVTLFSGGLDSLAGAVQDAVVKGRRIALVSHRSYPKIDSKQKALVQSLSDRTGGSLLFHVPVWINKDSDLSREHTQRTRTFLYASLVAAVANMFGLSRFCFHENGIVSFNLPISAQVIGARATRTTHPQAVNGFGKLFSLLLGKPFTVENPFMWKTKAELVALIGDAGCADLVAHTVSCSHTWQMTRQHSHCGRCSQCIDRRFATMASGYADVEPADGYDTDLFTGERH